MCIYSHREEQRRVTDTERNNAQESQSRVTDTEKKNAQESQSRVTDTQKNNTQDKRIKSTYTTQYYCYYYSPIPVCKFELN